MLNNEEIKTYPYCSDGVALSAYRVSLSTVDWCPTDTCGRAIGSLAFAFDQWSIAAAVARGLSSVTDTIIRWW